MDIRYASLRVAQLMAADLAKDGPVAIVSADGWFVVTQWPEPSDVVVEVLGV